ncbi:MAG: DnaB-like helicase C-terminal domain-containing protein [Gemmatimonadales bacterium]
MTIRRDEAAPIESLVARIDAVEPGTTACDTVPSGFPSLDRALGGGFRRQDLAVLAGDVASGKSALALGIAARAAMAGIPTVFLSGEMSPERVMERALALEGKAVIDDLRQGRLDAVTRAAVGAAALRLRNAPLLLRPLLGEDFDEVGSALEQVPGRRLLVVDSLQLTPSPRPAVRLDERITLAVRALKGLAVEMNVAVLALAQLPRHRADRNDPRPTLDDLGALGSIKQNADLVLAIYREEMYRPGHGVEGATELIIAKNRNGPTGFVDLYFYPRWLRFEDMLDPSS